MQWYNEGNQPANTLGTPRHFGADCHSPFRKKSAKNNSNSLANVGEGTQDFPAQKTVGKGLARAASENLDHYFCSAFIA
ncbi:MAG: Uncharacterised protein [Cryomorphaceae bacterium]|nr:MAG: Uncharacterised protein [Cryomorphaceae bacterium]